MRARFVETKHARARLRLVSARVCTDLYEKLFDDSLLPYEDKSQISYRSEFSLRRYLQNNTEICLILNFLCILHIFKM